MKAKTYTYSGKTYLFDLERRFRLKVTGRGVGGAKCNLIVMKKWSEICSGSTKMLSAVQLYTQSYIYCYI